MKISHASLMAVLLSTSLTALAAQPLIDLSISGEISPGVYGQVNLGNHPPPRLVRAKPIVIVPAHDPESVEPIYLHVPPGHAQNWRKHCRKYNACDKPVYFVRSSEYDQYEAKHEGKKHKHRGRSDEEHGNKERGNRERGNSEHDD